MLNTKLIVTIENVVTTHEEVNYKNGIDYKKDISYLFSSYKHPKTALNNDYEKE